MPSLKIDIPVATKSDAPSCSVCSESIDGEVLEWGGKKFHDQCFKCSACKGDLGDTCKNVQDSPCCVECADKARNSLIVSPSRPRSDSKHKRNKSDSSQISQSMSTMRGVKLDISSPRDDSRLASSVSSFANNSSPFVTRKNQGTLSPRKTGKLTGTQALLKWCQKRVDDKYDRIDLCNWKSAWADGLAICALAHHFYPDAIDYDSLKTETEEDRVHNLNLAFSVFEERGDVPQLVDAEDLLDPKFIDPKSMQTYMSTLRKYVDPQPDDSPLPKRSRQALVDRSSQATGAQECACGCKSNKQGYKQCKACGARPTK